MRRIYLDYASTTPLDPRVKKVMEPYLTNQFGNPSSIHAEGVIAKKALDIARTTVARCLEAHAEEIVFTSGGTEANNLAILGVLTPPPFQGGDKRGGSRKTTPLSLPLERGEGNIRPHIVTTTIEHSSVLEPLRELERQGRAEVTYVPVEPNGIVKAEKIISAIKPNTILVSVMYANNEIGTIQPIRKIGQAIQNLKISKPQNFKILFHSDACQAPLYLRCFVNALGVDLLTLDGHKIYGPKGIGALYVRRSTPLAPQLLGGGQEKGLRSTTENIPAIVGFAEAFRIATLEREKESARIKKIRDHLYLLIRANKHIDETTVVNGSMKEGERLPNNLNISLLRVDTEFLTLKLDATGIAVSTKSSCLRDEKSSYVISALGGGTKRAASSLRFTPGRGTTKKDIEYATKALTKLVSEKH